MPPRWWENLRIACSSSSHLELNSGTSRLIIGAACTSPEISSRPSRFLWWCGFMVEGKFAVLISTLCFNVAEYILDHSGTSQAAQQAIMAQTSSRFPSMES